MGIFSSAWGKKLKEKLAAKGGVKEGKSKRTGSSSSWDKARKGSKGRRDAAMYRREEARKSKATKTSKSKMPVNPRQKAAVERKEARKKKMYAAKEATTKFRAENKEKRQTRRDTKLSGLKARRDKRLGR